MFKTTRLVLMLVLTTVQLAKDAHSEAFTEPWRV